MDVSFDAMIDGRYSIDFFFCQNTIDYLPGAKTYMFCSMPKERESFWAAGGSTLFPRWPCKADWRTPRRRRRSSELSRRYL